ncbi:MULTISPECIES: hypothetical protein [Enterococcus]|uniref:DUF2187 domain-containing protein n=1 Tax=Enterococcus sulfureus ATCC 49903 TaxID=1140003 RepID=S0P1K0_9ENTE|nr:hypothetical protein [Enterococcus sulfureus]EOT47534.1 hypothetical protein OMY_00908 [Enterococcus sulfureus ATCC 49903]EOT84045.1 hypothetical protein I573_01770 [Enterococcus sulfureus ATCC 49903]
MENQVQIAFTWENETFQGLIEKEYENSYLIHVQNPNDELVEKYNGRIVISKKKCITDILL